MQNNENRQHNAERKPREKRTFSKEKEVDAIEKKLVNVNRVTKVVKGGRTMRFAALVVVGDKKGQVGIGTGKAAEVPQAIEKATQDAKKNMVKIALDGTTIPHEVIGKFGRSTVILMPAKEGTGVIAGGSVRPVAELVGIKDVTSKIHGSRSKINCARATLNGLMQLRSIEEVAALRGKTVEEIR